MSRTIRTSDFYSELQKIGVKKESKSWHDYEIGKQFVMKNKPAIDYNYYIRKLIDYLEL